MYTAAVGTRDGPLHELARTGRLPAPVFRLGQRIVISRLALERVLAAERAAGGGENDGAA